MSTDSTVKEINESSAQAALVESSPAPAPKRNAGAQRKAPAKGKEPKQANRASLGLSSKTSTTEKLVCRYCGSDDLTASFVKRRDARCRACFKKRYGSSARNKKTVVRKARKASK
jgi:hypothetical protein